MDWMFVTSSTRSTWHSVAGPAEDCYLAELGSNPDSDALKTSDIFGWGCGPCRGRHFQDFFDGGVEGQVPAAAHVPLRFEFEEVADSMGNPKPLSVPASHPCAVAFDYDRLNAHVASNGPLHYCAVLGCGNCRQHLSVPEWPCVHMLYEALMRARVKVYHPHLLPPLASTGYCLQLLRIGMSQILPPRL